MKKAMQVSTEKNQIGDVNVFEQKDKETKEPTGDYRVKLVYLGRAKNDKGFWKPTAMEKMMLLSELKKAPEFKDATEKNIAEKLVGKTLVSTTTIE